MLPIVYVDMGLSSNNPVVLTVVTAGQSFSRTFSIKITQIECDSLAKGIFMEIILNYSKMLLQAANGCLQYFTGVSGSLESFNYNNAAGLQLSDTDYTICVRMERNFCGIQYNACADNTVVSPTQNPTQSLTQSFSISGTSGNTFSQTGSSQVCCNKFCYSTQVFIQICNIQNYLVPY